MGISKSDAEQLEKLIKLMNLIGFKEDRSEEKHKIFLFNTTNKIYEIWKYHNIPSFYDVKFIINYKNDIQQKEYRLYSKECIEFFNKEFKSEIRQRKIELLNG